MTREQIEAAAKEFIFHDWSPKKSAAENMVLFAIQQINAALDKAALIVGYEKWSNQTTYADKIRALKIK